MQPFGATNKPGTCKWCGRKLRRKMYVERGPSQYPKLSQCCHAALEPSHRDPSTIRYCSSCGERVGRTVHPVVSRTPAYDKPGDYGDGHFCGLGCGYQFGRALANGGRLLQPRAGDE